MSRFAMRPFALSALVATFLAGLAATSRAGDQMPINLSVSGAWTKNAQSAFYTTDQGSQMILLAWIKALHHKDGTPFLADNLSRYGYLPNPGSPGGLPVGFTKASTPQGDMMGMSCAACHTRQIEAEGKVLRIDGGPAIVDFQAFLTDLDAAVLDVQVSDATFLTFAKAVLGSDFEDPNKVAVLRADLIYWSLRFDTLMKKALPNPGWGPSRLDAVGMIFDRLSGLDLGPAPTYLIPGNIQKADAPTRYPFLWNAPIQDKTQWPGFADNGDNLLGLARNLGEVYGVFGTFHPTPSKWFFQLNRDYVSINSANFRGLWALEDLIKTLQPPVWPFGIDKTLAEAGKAVFYRDAKGGSCASCHDIQPGQTRFLNQKTWKTPIINVGTDTREWGVLGWKGATGVLDGADIPFVTTKIGGTDKVFNMLSASVVGAIIQHFVPVLTVATPVGGVPINPSNRLEANAAAGGVPGGRALANPLQVQGLRGAFHLPGLPTAATTAPPPVNAYESRVLQGIWAVAPYLHNGSVPTLAALLTPPAQRVKSFKIGPAYDTSNVGLAVDQPKFDYTLLTTGCDALNSGNSNCGHDYGTDLSDADKKALLEYLKVL